jgi:hypothetical protein
MFSRLINPIDDLSSVYGHGDVVFFFDELKLVKKGGVCSYASFSVLDGDKSLIFPQVSKGPVGFFGIVCIKRNMIIV